MWKIPLVVGIAVVAAWPWLYSHHESLWWVGPAGLLITFSGVIASG